MEAPSFDLEQLREHLDTLFFGMGKRLVFLPTVASTNTFAMQLARNGSEEGVVVLTDSQTAGKGRQGRNWVDMSGCNAISSTILRPLFPPYLLVMVASLAVIDTITETCGVAATIKWPNDILIGTRKVTGILIETSSDLTGRLVAILGIGVNVNGHMADLIGKAEPTQTVQQTLITAATTLETECGHPLSREVFLACLLRHLETNYLALQQEAQDSGTHSSSQLMRERWHDHLSTLGRTVQVQQGEHILSGVAEDVNEDGELLLRRHSGERVSITWGDVWHFPDIPQTQSN